MWSLILISLVTLAQSQNFYGLVVSDSMCAMEACPCTSGLCFTDCNVNAFWIQDASITAADCQGYCDAEPNCVGLTWGDSTTANTEGLCMIHGDANMVNPGTGWGSNPKTAYTIDTSGTVFTGSASAGCHCYVVVPDPTRSPSASPTGSPSASPTVSPTRSPSTSPSHGPTVSPSTTCPSGSPSGSPSTPPSLSPSTSSPTRSPSSSPTKSPSTSPSFSPTTTSPSVSPTKAPSNSPSTTPTQSPNTSAPTLSPSVSPTKAPSNSPSTTPTQSPNTSAPTLSPSVSPTKSPSNSPSTTPTQSPNTSAPTLSPSVSPTKAPSNSPSTTPTQSPNTSTPTHSPSVSPTARPSKSPSAQPTQSPSVSPTANPSNSPSAKPSQSPETTIPTASPSASPSDSPTKSPSSKPSISPVTSTPSNSPSGSPSVSPVTSTANPSTSPEETTEAVQETTQDASGNGVPTGYPTYSNGYGVLTLHIVFENITEGEFGEKNETVLDILATELDSERSDVTWGEIDYSDNVDGDALVKTYNWLEQSTMLETAEDLQWQSDFSAQVAALFAKDPETFEVFITEVKSEDIAGAVEIDHRSNESDSGSSSNIFDEYSEYFEWPKILVTAGLVIALIIVAAVFCFCCVYCCKKHSKAGKEDFNSEKEDIDLCEREQVTYNVDDNGETVLYCGDGIPNEKQEPLNYNHIHE